MIDWTFALMFRPDITKVGLDRDTAFVLREAAVDEMRAAHVGAGGVVERQGPACSSPHPKRNGRACIS